MFLDETWQVEVRGIGRGDGFGFGVFLVGEARWQGGGHFLPNAAHNPKSDAAQQSNEERSY
jgi:hypothetical protein